MSVAPYIPIDKPAPRAKKTPKRIERTAFKRHGAKSARKVQQLRDWNAEKDRAWLACGGYCVVKIKEVCTGRAQHPHHMRKRSLGGHVDPRCLWTCAACHRWIEEHPRFAGLLGFSDYRKEATTQI